MSQQWDEYHLVEQKALHDFEKLGWTVHDTTKDYNRSNYDKRENLKTLLLEDRLREAIKRINPWINENNLNKAVNQIKHIRAINHMQANKQIHSLLVKHLSVEQDRGKGKKHQTVKIIDYDNISKNDFLILNQYNVTGRKETIKPDIVAFINGIPIAVMECKSPTIVDPENQALEQMMRYQNQRGGTHEGCEPLFRYNLFSIITWDHNAKVGTYKTPAEYYKSWKDPYPATKEELQTLFEKENITNQDILIYSLFKKDRLLDLLQNFTVFQEQNQKTIKIVARYQQYRAVQKTLHRLQNLQPTDPKGGIVWHTQGSGKSLTMLFLGLKLRRLKDNPTLLLITDREALDQQIHDTFMQCGFPNPKRAESIKDLEQKLSQNAGETITTLIHKFQFDQPDTLVSDSSNIYVMIDEAHRTQYKDLANNMRTTLPNAFYIGFTGTPIEKQKRNTKKTFGNYIDTYTIDQSIADGTTIEIKYQGRLADIHLDGIDLDTIFDRVFKDKTEKEKKEIRKRYAREQDLAEAPKRIEEICLDLLQHYEEKISEPFKAMIVTTSKQAAVNYKKQLEKYNAPETAVIISQGHNDKPDIKTYTPSEEEKNQLKKRFLNPNDPLKIFIVCDMLLTGFDAPILQVMYLDKPLKEHSLLQAIARVNRPYPEKNYGLIIDYYGISDNLKEALQRFTSEDVESAMTPLENELPRLQAAHRKAMSFFTNIDSEDLDDYVGALEKEDTRIEFNQAFKQFSKMMDIVLPSPKANPYKEDLKKLGKIYAKAKNDYMDESMNLAGCGQKVKDIIRTHITSAGIDILNQQPVSIMDRQEFDNEINTTTSPKRKMSIMEHKIQYEISQRKAEDPPFYNSLHQRVKDLIEQYRTRRKDEQQFISEYWKIVDAVRNREQEAEQLGFEDTSQLSFYHTLQETFKQKDTTILTEQQLIEMTKEITEKVKKMRVIDWKAKIKVQKNMRKTIKLYLYSKPNLQLSKDEIDALVTNLLQLARRWY